MKIAALAAALVLSAGPALAQDATDISFTFELGQPTGAIMVALFDSEASYGGEGQPVRVARIEVTGATATAAFEGLPAGDYAMRSFHDVDGDGEMDTNPFGMPTEPFGFSNNAVGNMGPASWDRARFTASGDVAQTIDLAQ
jgi:uncharacterized protein (DUF2141 family)